MTDAPDRLLHTVWKTILSEVRSDQPDLTTRQLAVTLTVYGTAELQTVRSLAKHLNIGKPAITRALTRLGELDLMQRAIDPRDRRSVLVMRTPAGTAMMRRLADAATAPSSD